MKKLLMSLCLLVAYSNIKAMNKARSQDPTETMVQQGSSLTEQSDQLADTMKPTKDKEAVKVKKLEGLDLIKEAVSKQQKKPFKQDVFALPPNPNKRSGFPSKNTNQ